MVERSFVLRTINPDKIYSAAAFAAQFLYIFPTCSHMRQHTSLAFTTNKSVKDVLGLKCKGCV